MRFAALFGKEFRECLPWMLLAAIVLLAFGGFAVRTQAMANPNWRWSQAYNLPGTPMEPYRLVSYSRLAITGPWLLCCSLGLGLILGVCHFWIPQFTRTWPFLLHRSVRRSMVLAAKLLAASVALVLATGVVWIILFWYACRPEVFGVPQPARVFVEGWIFIVLGLVAYLGTSLSGLSEARWYTTRIFGIVFAAIIIFVTLMQWSLAWALAVIAFGAALLVQLLFDTFATREF